MKKRLSLGQSGGATVALTGALAFALLLMAAFAQRNLVSGLQISASRYHAAQAFEAAEAGLEWTLARLNNGTRLDAACLVSDRPQALAFGERVLAPADEDGDRRPRSDGDGPLQTHCSGQAGVWSCTCPGEPGGQARQEESPTPGGPGASDASAGQEVHFTTWLLPGERPGLLRLLSAGCSGGGSPCPAGLGEGSASTPAASPSRSDASAQLQVALARLPALAGEPLAALSVQGSLELGAHPWVLQHEGGATLHAGGDVLASRLVLQGPSGTPPAATARTGDTVLGGLSPDVLFAGLFRLNKQAWPQQPTVRRIDCHQACDSRLAEALGPGPDRPLVWLDGGLHLNRPATLGTPTQPVLLIADGPVRLDAAVVIHGLVYGTAPDWSAAEGASIQGAVVQEGALRGQGSLHIRHDAAVLKRLHTQYGTWARVAGSWRDF